MLEHFLFQKQTKNCFVYNSTNIIEHQTHPAKRIVWNEIVSSMIYRIYFKTRHGTERIELYL